MKSKISPCPTSEHTNDLAWDASFRQAHDVSRLGFLLASMVLTTTASAAPKSDPAFLGISMDPTPIGCSIGGITNDSPAEDAGIRFGDIVTAIDGVTIPGGGTACQVLANEIAARKPGERVKLDIRRGANSVVINASLSTRSDILHRRLVGKQMVSTELVDFDHDDREIDLADPRGQTSVVGWFNLRRCVGCSAVFDRVADGIKKRLADARPTVIAVTSKGDPFAQGLQQTPDSLRTLRKSFTSSVPIVMAEPTEFDDLAFKDSDRVSFMVIDCRGVVRFVAPIAPGSDDIEAAVDEVLAATEQAEHLRTRR